MGYPSNPPNDEARKILTIIMPFGAFECMTLPMGVMSASNLFQLRMCHLFAKLNERKPFVYIDDILHYRGGKFEEHLSFYNEILKLIVTSGMQVSTKKSRFCQQSLEYLGFKLNHHGYKPLASRVSAILCINPPANIRQVRAFLGMINFIKNHIPWRDKICEPITHLTHKDIKFAWMEMQRPSIR
jgi:hypothetical protein